MKKPFIHFSVSLIFLILILTPFISATNVQNFNSVTSNQLSENYQSQIIFVLNDENETDTDQDGMPDAWEIENDLDIDRDDSNFDYDFDELVNLDEYLYGTDPWNEDTDGDRFNDGFEVAKGTDPADPADHPTRVWLFILIGILSVTVLAGISWVVIISVKDSKNTKKQMKEGSQ
ncbi:MAG: hypothetical protein ACTSQK_07035 [Candidatus Heimdallarchaeota archaeon]